LSSLIIDISFIAALVCSGIVVERVFASYMGRKADEAKVAAHVEKAKAGLDVLDKHLSKNQYIAGGQFTLGDLVFMPYFQHLANTPEGSLISSRPNVAAWWKRISERPTWQKTLAYAKQ
jgi:glutathione S-transferase